MSLNRLRCLLIEDEPEICRFLSVTLSLNDWNVEAIHAGRRGLVRAATWRPDLIILDLGLPDMDGIDVLTQLRTWSQVPLIVLTARVAEPEKIRALDAGADDSNHNLAPCVLDEMSSLKHGIGLADASRGAQKHFE